MTSPNLESTEAERQRAKEDLEYLPPGFELVKAETLEKVVHGTFWDYCPIFFIQCIGLGLALTSLAIGYGAWKYFIGM
jgi:hypothetical protein